MIPCPSLFATRRMAAVGASSPLPRVPEKVPSPYFADPHHRASQIGSLWSSRPTPGKPPAGKLDGGEGNEGGQGFGQVLEVLGETPVSSKPGEGALDHPAARHDDEALPVVAPLDDLHAQHRHLGHPSDRSDNNRPPADKSGGAPAST